MEKQEVKIEFNGNDVFFFEHTFKSAYEHARDFIERNKDQFEMKVFLLNTSCFGEKWILDEIITPSKNDDNTPVNVNLIKKLMAENDCPEDKIDRHLVDLTRKLNNQYHSEYHKHLTFWDYLCSYDADSFVNDYVASDILNEG